ncbi:hypothetical protein Btru_003234 [Bulinus truncatus]|nr:hypothetical protein Btru_003234 [Bulinus truncatus]
MKAEQGELSYLDQSHLESGESQVDNVVSLKRKLQESELVQRQQVKQIQQLQEELVIHKYRLLDQLDANHADTQGVLCDLRVLRENLNYESLSFSEEMRSERQAIVNQLFRVIHQKNNLTQSLKQVKDEQEKLVEQTESRIEELGKCDHGLDLDVFDNIEKENLTLRTEKLKYEEQIALLEKKASVYASENLSLIQKVEHLQAELRKYNSDIRDVADSDDTLDMLSSSLSSGDHPRNSARQIGSEEIDKEIALLKAELQSQSQDLANVDMERTDWMMEREALEDVITELRQKAQTLDQELLSLKSSASGRSRESNAEETQDRMKALEAEISALQQENTELKNALEELDAQHTDAIDQLIQKRNQMASQLSEKNKEIRQQQETIDQLKKSVTELQENLGGAGESRNKEASVWEEKCHHYEIELRKMSAELSDAEKFKVSLEKEMTDLRQKLHKGGQVINDLHMDKQELQEELERAKSEIAVKVSKIKEMREDHKSLSMEKKGLKVQLQDMRVRLSEMEQEVENWQQVNETKQVEKLNNAGQKLDECAELKSKLSALEEEKKFFSANFEQLLSDQLKENSQECQMSDSAFQKILEEEAKVRRQIESDGKLINDLKLQVQKLYNEKQKLKDELHESHLLQTSTSEKFKQLEVEHSQTLSQLEAEQKNILELERKLSHAVEERQLLSQTLVDVRTKYDQVVKLNEELSLALSNTQTEKLALSKQLESQIRYSEKLMSEQDSESLLAENKKLLGTQEEFAVKVEELQAEVKEKTSQLIAKGKNLEDMEHKLTSAQAESAATVLEINRLQSSCAEKEQEIERLKGLLTKLEKQKSIVDQVNNSIHLEMTHSGIRDSVKELNEKNTELDQQDIHNKVIQLQNELSACHETITRLQQELLEAQETIHCHEAGIADLNEKSDEHRRALEKSVLDLTRHKSTIAVLRQTSVDKETLLNEAEAKLNFLITILSPEQIELFKTFTSTGRPAIEYKEVQAIEYSALSASESSSASSLTKVTTTLQSSASYGDLKISSDKPDSSHNGYIVDESSESSLSDQDRCYELEKEISRLYAEIREKDQALAELQKSNAALLALFEKGAADKNVASQFEVHRLEAELRDLRSEREQLMAVVSEKSRESSSLKLETHRLMTALSASQVALSKLQEDNRELHQRQSSSSLDEEVDDMRREALANMARLVRDKETELEALKQKNETLLAVLQSSSETQAANHLAPLLKDKETLTQQLATLTSEREQLIACLTQKHAESVAFHAETQRLSALLAEVQGAYEKTKTEYQVLVAKFDDKAQALVAAQNELVQCKQRLSVLEVRHGELIQRSNSLDLSKPDTSGLSAEVETLKQGESALRLELCQRDEKLQSLTHRLSTLEEELVSKDTECTHLRKQLENAKFQLTGLMAEIADLKTDREQIQKKNVAQDSEFVSFREACNKMTIELKEKDNSISALRDQVATLTSVLHEKQGEQGHISKLMKENHEAVSQTQQLQHERDQLTLLLEQRGQQCQSLQAEVSYHKEKEFKISKELERLRKHLIETEEGYTKDALESEEREKELRNKLAIAEEQAMLYHSKMEMASQDNVRQIENLQQQLQHVAGQRDSAYMQLSNIQEQCQQYATSLSNLQLVLEHFQKEKEAAISAEVDYLERECKSLRLELEEKNKELSATKGDLMEALEGLEAASRLSDQLDRREEAINALKEEVLLRERALESAEAEIHKLTSTSEVKVDKTLMHNMVMTWLTSPDNKRAEIVHLIGHVLSFSDDDFNKIEMAQSKKGLLSGIFSRSPVVEWTPTKSTQSNQSFSQLFVKFLEKESSLPSSPVRLPAEAMAAEAQHRHKNAFNPFTAPRHVTHKLQMSASPSAHLLISNDIAHIAPMSSPLFAPISNPSNESAILKDVLGKR